MDPKAQAQLSQDVIALAAARFGTTADALRPLGGFENAVYAYDTPDGARVLRLTHDSHRRAAQVRAELHWLSALVAAGLDVAAAVPSVEGRLVETLTAADGSAFHVAAFVHAPGGRATADQFTPDVLHAWGGLLGRLRAVSRTYRPEDPAGRPVWTDDPHHRDRHAYAHLVEPDVMTRYDALVARLSGVPRTPDNFGLVHNDAHTGNFHLSVSRSGGPRIVLFDFDDAGYNFFAQDVAMALYYALWTEPDDRVAFARHFLTHLLAGYREHAELDEADLRLLPDLLKLREVMLYVLLRRFLNPDDLTEPQRRLLDRTRRGALSDEPLLDLDFTEFRIHAPKMVE